MSEYDPRLDRIREVDLRSLNFLVELPADTSDVEGTFEWACDFYLDQGQEGACVGFGITHEMAASPVQINYVSEASAFELYRTAQLLDEWPGEDYEGTSVLAGLKVATDWRYYTGYKWALTIEEFVLAVATQGPGVIGVDWYPGMYDVDADGFLKPTGRIVGGHCILARGVHIERNPDGTIDFLRSWVLLHNSWGRSWGVNGTARMSLIDFMKLWPGGDFAIPQRNRP